ncbi:unnamed protein product [Phaedon cochleariae]|uniref:UNC93-like protein n=1 Tax=Phaedon cochleariae TaxID=80249 RepID=A0A9P0DSQ2_PHACE|nr:unnamed protein product [Phaedon cochleariae]
MVYSISDHVDKVTQNQETMDSKFQRVKTTDTDEEEFTQKEQCRIWKNVLLIGFAFMIHFTAFWGASNLQSSVNSEASLGTFTLAAIYGSLLLSNIFLPVMVIKWLGAKWAIAASFVMYMPFIIAQFHPKFSTMIPAGLLIGLGGGPLWCAKCTYLTVIAEVSSKLTKTESEIVVTRFFGIFFMFYSFSQVWGNLISSAVLSSGLDDILSEPNATAFNATELFLNNTSAVVNSIADVVDICGADFCPGMATASSNPNLKLPSSFKINLISGIYLACMIGACLIVAVGVDKMSRYGKGRSGSGTGITGLKLLAVTLKQLGDFKQLLILPITMFIGAEQAFIAADFTSAFVSCGWGINNIGFVMICFGVCNGIASIFSGSIVKITGRNPVICFALSLHFALLVTLLVWKPSVDNKPLFFLISGLWGICDALWLVQINSLSGILFPGKEEAAYSNFRLWESTGSVITYACSPYLCTYLKLYLLMGLLVVGVIGYTAVEYIKHKNESDEYDPIRSGKAKFELAGTVDKKSGEVAE